MCVFGVRAKMCEQLFMCNNTLNVITLLIKPSDSSQSAVLLSYLSELSDNSGLIKKTEFCTIFANGNSVKVRAKRPVLTTCENHSF